MSRATEGTSIEYWLSLPLSELVEWAEDLRALLREEAEQQQRQT
jgi:hypothetical protein